jgi:hypothetical protein
MVLIGLLTDGIGRYRVVLDDKEPIPHGQFRLYIRYMTALTLPDKIRVCPWCEVCRLAKMQDSVATECSAHRRSATLGFTYRAGMN